MAMARGAAADRFALQVGRVEAWVVAGGREWGRRADSPKYTWQGTNTNTSVRGLEHNVRPALHHITCAIWQPFWRLLL